MERSKRKSGRLSVFKGREAKLNFAIFHTLALKGPQTIYDIHKEVKAQKRLKHTKSTNVLRRIRALEESGYLEKAGTRKTLPGYERVLLQTFLQNIFGALAQQNKPRQVHPNSRRRHYHRNASSLDVIHDNLTSNMHCGKQKI